MIKIPKRGHFSQAFHGHVLADIAKACVELVTGSEETHDRMLAYFTGRPEVYFHFSVNKDTQVEMEEWKKLEVVAAATANYVESPNIQHQLRQVTQSLSSQGVQMRVSEISKDNHLSLHARHLIF
jgi:hypothetical protein